MSGFVGLDPCVHCGFCLQSCPTYLVTGDESDGPRGRIVLMRALAAGRIPSNDPHLVFHLDRCLGCRACEPACPSGVAYGAALEEARHRLAATHPIPALARLVTVVMARPAIRTVALAVARGVRPLAEHVAGNSRLGFAMGMLAATRDVGPATTVPDRSSLPAPGSTPALAALFRGCIMDGLFSHVHEATLRTLAVNGISVASATAGETCCGALHAHNGQHRAAQQLARQNVAAFAGEPRQTVVVNSAGCGAMLKEYGQLLAGDPLESAACAFAERVRDVSEVLAEQGPRPGARLDLTVAYDPPCHLLHAQRVEEAPRRLLDAVPGLRQTPYPDADLCCGSAGSYSLTEPELSRGVLDRKLSALRQASPDIVATGNPGCVMQIGAGLAATGTPTPVVHPVEILDWSYRAAGYY